MPIFILGIFTQLSLVLLFDHKQDAIFVGIVLAIVLTSTYVIKFRFLGGYLFKRLSGVLQPAITKVTPPVIINSIDD